MKQLCLIVLCALSTFAGGNVNGSQSALFEFKRQYPCPATGSTKGACKGYLISHVTPLACGGTDQLENLQWQMIAQAKLKNKSEVKACGKSKTLEK